MFFVHEMEERIPLHPSYFSSEAPDSIRELLDSGINQLVSGLLYMVFTAVALVALDPQSGLVLAVALEVVFSVVQRLVVPAGVTAGRPTDSRARVARRAPGTATPLQEEGTQ